MVRHKGTRRRAACYHVHARRLDLHCRQGLLGRSGSDVSSCKRSMDDTLPALDSFHGAEITSRKPRLSKYRLM